MVATLQPEFVSTISYIFAALFKIIKTQFSNKSMKKIITLLIIAVFSITTVVAQKPAIRNNNSYRTTTNVSNVARLNKGTNTQHRPKTYSSPAVPLEKVKHYTNSEGYRVQSPTRYSSVPAGATAVCRDGTYSFSKNRRGTCSHHGGVAYWLK